MSDDISSSLREITKGSAIILVGTAVALGLGFFSNIFLVRILSQEQRGLFSLGRVILEFVKIFTFLGLTAGIPRYIGFYKNDNKIKGVMTTGMIISLIMSIFLGIILFLFSNSIAMFFNEPNLSILLKYLSVSLPFASELNIMITIFQGHGRADVRAIFGNILRSIIYITGLGIIFYITKQGTSYGFNSLQITFSILLLSFILPSIILLFYTFRKFDFSNPDLSVWKNLLKHSIPLSISGILSILMLRTDILFLGYFLPGDKVGLYGGGAVPLARILPIFLSSFGFLYTPIASNLYSNNLNEEMMRVYQVVTKWISSLTLPAFLILILFPKLVIDFIFGADYVPAANSLRILSIGFFIHAILGPNGASLNVLGKSKFIMISNLIAAIGNMMLNLFLIPRIGILGAAIATGSSYIISNTILSLKLYKEENIQPFTANYLKPFVLSIAIALSFYKLIDFIFIKTPNYLLPILFMLFVFIYGLSLLLTKSFDKEDIEILLSIEERLGLNLKWIKKILKRFI